MYDFEEKNMNNWSSGLSKFEKGQKTFKKKNNCTISEPSFLKLEWYFWLACLKQGVELSMSGDNSVILFCVKDTLQFYLIVVMKIVLFDIR